MISADDLKPLTTAQKKAARPLYTRFRFWLRSIGCCHGVSLAKLVDGKEEHMCAYCATLWYEDMPQHKPKDE